MRYDMQVRKNIGFGRIDELRNQPRIEEAARKSLAEPLIAQLARGYDQMLGRRFEKAWIIGRTVAENCSGALTCAMLKF